MKAVTVVDHLISGITLPFKHGTSISIPRIPRSAEAALIWGLHRRLKTTILWISDGRHSLELMHRDMLTLRPAVDDTPLFYPAAEHDSKGLVDHDISGQRLNVLVKIGSLCNSLREISCESHIITTSIQALMQKGINPEEISKQTNFLDVGKEYDIESLVDNLE